MSEIKEMDDKRIAVDLLCSKIDNMPDEVTYTNFCHWRHSHNEFRYVTWEKFYYLKTLLQRRNETSVRRYVEAFVNSLWEKSDDIQSSVTKHIFESCLPVELFRRFKMKQLRKDDDPVLGDVEALNEIRLDWLRHSPPFDSLLLLFNLSKNEADPQDSLIELALHFFQDMIGHFIFKPVHIRKIQTIRHENLLDLVYNALCSQLLDYKMLLLRNRNPKYMEEDLQLVNYATELQEAGIMFRKWKGETILDIKFKNGIMKIPTLKVSETTLTVLRMLIEHEAEFRCGPFCQRCVTDYVKFLKCLVNSPKDVKLLRRNGIIENCFGSNEQAVEQISGLDRPVTRGTCEEVKMSEYFTYFGVFRKVNRHSSIVATNGWPNYGTTISTAHGH